MVRNTFISIVLLLIISSCNHEIEPVAVTYKHSLNGKPNSLDPRRASDKYSTALTLIMFETLYEYQYLKRPYKLKPGLAWNMPKVSADGLSYTIELRPGVYFHDDEAFPGGKGREVIGQDVVYSIMRNFEQGAVTPGAWLWRDHIIGLKEWGSKPADYDAEIEGLKAKGKMVYIKLHKPYPQLLHTLAMSHAAIVPREAVEYYGKEFGRNPVGSGPYKFSGFNDQMAKYTRNDRYWGRMVPIELKYEGYEAGIHEKYGLAAIEGKTLPFIDEIEVHFIEEASSRWNSFTKGNEIQYSTVPTAMSNRVIKSKAPLQVNDELAAEYHHAFNNELGFAYFGFDLESESFGKSEDKQTDENNRLLRCAIRKAHDWQQRNDAFYFGIGQVLRL